jgi:hypothetical protein
LDRLVEVLTREHASPFHRIQPEEFEREVVQIRASMRELDGNRDCTRIPQAGCVDR